MTSVATTEPRTRYAASSDGPDIAVPSNGAAERTVQYVTTEDGVRIAYRTVGEGRPLISMSLESRVTIELTSELPEVGLWGPHTIAGRKHVIFDYRGFGLSSGQPDGTLESRTRDLAAVAESLGEPVVLFAPFTSGPPGIAYAASRLERVTALVLWCSFASMSLLLAELDTTVDLLALDPELFAKHAALTYLGWKGGSRLQRFAELYGLRPETPGFRASDVSALLDRVKAPTLVLHPSAAPRKPVRLGRELASGIPRSRFQIVESACVAPFADAAADVRGCIEDFLQAIDPSPSVSPDAGGGALEEAVAAAGDGEQPPAQAHPLTARETEVLGLLARGRANREIADELMLSVRTVERHAENIYSKVDIRNRSEATAYAVRTGLV